MAVRFFTLVRNYHREEDGDEKRDGVGVRSGMEADMRTELGTGIEMKWRWGWS